MSRFFLTFIFVLILLNSSTWHVNSYYTNMSAEMVLGQTNFTSGSANQGGSASSGTLSNPLGVTVAQGRLFVADQGNHRILVWNQLPVVNGKSADLVLGQPNFSSVSVNSGLASPTSNTLWNPVGIYSDGIKLYVADNSNNRVLIWNTLPTVNQQAADVVLGQTNFTSNTAGTTSNTFSSPFGIFVSNGKLFISERGNRRISIYNNVPATSGASADVVVGQDDFTTGSYGGIAANRFGTSSSTSGPRAVAVHDNKLIVLDTENARILVFNQIPTSNGVSADLVLGQPDFTSGTSDNGGISCSTLSNVVTGVFVNSNGRLMIGDGARILFFNKFPTTNFQAADLVLGQPNCSVRTQNNGGISANSLFNARNIFELGDRLFVSDSSGVSNNRLLIFNNVLSSPHLSVSNVEQLSGDSGKLKITGSTEIGERGRYSLSSVVASVNGLGYGNVTSKDNGRDNGDGKTLYEFTHEFEPWVNNNGDKNTWRDKGYTVSLKAISSNAEEDEVLLFSPFVLKAMSKDTSSLEFSVPTAHWSTLVDKLSYYTVEVKRKTDKEWSTLTTISPSHSNNTTVSGSTTNPTYTSTLPSSSLTPLSKSLKINTVTSSYTPSTGEIKVKVDTTLPSGEYRILAVSSTGNTFSSNTISHTSSTVSYLPSLTLTTSWFPLQINKITGTNLSILSSFSTYTPKPLTSSTLTPTVSGIAPSYSTVYLQVTNSSTPTQKKLYKTTTTSSTSFSLPITLYTNSTLDTWVTNQHNTTVLSPIALSSNVNLSVLNEYTTGMKKVGRVGY